MSLVIIRDLMASGKHDEALALIDRMTGRDDCPSLLVRRAMCAQLGDEAGPTLDTIADWLERAWSLDPWYADAALELGWMQLRVLDDASSAKQRFGEALTLLVRKTCEAIAGMVEAEAEIEGVAPLRPEAAAAEWRGRISEMMAQRLAEFRWDD